MRQTDLSERLIDGDAINQQLAFRIARLQAKLNADALRLLDNVSGLTLTQWRILVLLHASGAGRASDLVRLSAIDKGLMSRTIKQMLQSGLICAEVDPQDNRAQVIDLSPLGRTLYEATLPHMQSRRDMLHSQLTKNETETFYAVIDKLENAIVREAC